MRRIIRLSALSLTVLAVGCLGGYTPPPTGGANGPAQGSNQDTSGTNGTGSGGQPAAPASNPAPAPALGAAPPATAELVKFGQCMTSTDFTSSGMDAIAKQMTDSGPCLSCHGSGMFNVYLSGDATKDLSHLRSLPFLFKFAEIEANPDGTLKDIVPANRFSARGQEITLNHPPYTLASSNAQALTDFFNLTMTHYKAGNCTGM